MILKLSLVIFNPTTGENKLANLLIHKCLPYLPPQNLRLQTIPFLSIFLMWKIRNDFLHFPCSIQAVWAELSKQGTFVKGQGPLYFQLSLVHEESTSSIQTTDKVKQGMTTHSGVLEFTADQGSVGLPPHVGNNLFSEGTSKPPLVDVRYVWLPKGTYSKLQPERVGFSD